MSSTFWLEAHCHAGVETQRSKPQLGDSRTQGPRRDCKHCVHVHIQLHAMYVFSNTCHRPEVLVLAQCALKTADCWLVRWTSPCAVTVHSAMPLNAVHCSKIAILMVQQG